jgi:hypothetical protein
LFVAVEDSGDGVVYVFAGEEGVLGVGVEDLMGRDGGTKTGRDEFVDEATDDGADGDGADVVEGVDQAFLFREGRDV